jgi:hypothetical protein
LKKLTIFFSIRGGQNQFFGLFSAPDDPKSKTQIYLESASKNTSEKNATKKNYITPTQIFDVKGRKTWSQKGHFSENPMGDRIKPKPVSE